MIKYTVVITLFPILFYQCEGSRYHLVDDFGVQLKHQVELGSFIHNLNADNPKAFNVKSVEWNDNIIIFSNENEINKIEFYIIYSPNQVLKSCFIDNLVLGPLTFNEVKSFR